MSKIDLSELRYSTDADISSENSAVTDYKARLLERLEELEVKIDQNPSGSVRHTYKEALTEIQKIVEEL